MKIPSNNPSNNSPAKNNSNKISQIQYFLFPGTAFASNKAPGSHWIGEFERLEEMKERRKFIRYKIPGNLCQVFSHKTSIAWKVKDISKSGLAFEHHPEAGDMTGLTKIDIVANCPNRFYLIGVPCQTVYDVTEILENRTFTGSEIRSCGLQYKSLQKRQKTNLEVLLEFLRQHF